MSSPPGSPAALRTANQQRVLDALRGRGGSLQPGQPDTTQADLARSTGLAPATVSSIVRELAEAGLVDTEPGSGRRGGSVRLSPSAGLVAGIDFGHSHVSVALGDVRGQILAEHRERLPANHEYVDGLTAAESILAQLLAEKKLRREDLRTVGVGLPAPITDGVVRASAILPGWVGVTASGVVTERFGVESHVENDSNLGALAEHRIGVARGHRNSVFVKISSGVGAGIVLNDELFHGSDGTAGEVGHLTLDDQGPMCRCGSRGCLEAYVSTGAVSAMLAGQLPEARIDEIVEAAKKGNVAALRAIEDAGLHLGWGLASVVNLLNPGLVVVGGEMARAGELLLEATRVGLRRHALDAVATTPVAVSELGERASMVGAVILAADRTQLLG